MIRKLLIAALAVVPAVASAQAVSVKLSEWKLAMVSDTVKAGAVTFRVENTGTMSHAFYVRGTGVEKGSRDISPGESANVLVNLKAGTYDIFCPMSDGSHKMAGMARKLVVIPAAPAAPPKKP